MSGTAVLPDFCVLQSWIVFGYYYCRWITAFKEGFRLQLLSKVQNSIVMPTCHPHNTLLYWNVFEYCFAFSCHQRAFIIHLFLHFIWIAITRPTISIFYDFIFFQMWTVFQMYASVNAEELDSKAFWNKFKLYRTHTRPKTFV